MEQIDYGQNEGLQTQKELVRNLEEKRGILAEIEIENKDFQVKLGVKAKEKEGLRSQIVEVEHLVSLMSYQLENIDLNATKISMVADKEDELALQKAQIEKQCASMVGTDLQDQTKSLQADLSEMAQI